MSIKVKKSMVTKNIEISLPQEIHQITVEGDTYEIRGDLWKLGFIWNKKKRRWEMTVMEEETLITILEPLRRLIDNKFGGII